jgi:hypothetical protein
MANRTDVEAQQVHGTNPQVATPPFLPPPFPHFTFLPLHRPPSSAFSSAHAACCKPSADDYAVSH